MHFVSTGKNDRHCDMCVNGGCFMVAFFGFFYWHTISGASFFVNANSHEEFVFGDVELKKQLLACSSRYFFFNTWLSLLSVLGLGGGNHFVSVTLKLKKEVWHPLTTLPKKSNNTYVSSLRETHPPFQPPEAAGFQVGALVAFDPTCALEGIVFDQLLGDETCACRSFHGLTGRAGQWFLFR